MSLTDYNHPTPAYAAALALASGGELAVEVDNLSGAIGYALDGADDWGGPDLFRIEQLSTMQALVEAEIARRNATIEADRSAGDRRPA